LLRRAGGLGSRLTAGHCARALALQDFSAVFDFYYESPGVLAYSATSAVPVSTIVAERLDGQNSDPELDYAWLRLKTPVTPPRRPVPVHTVASGLRNGDALLVMGNGGGIPLKIDSGASVRDVRTQSLDYFSADADNFSGASGGAALDQQLTLTGIVSRGQLDFELAESGCQKAVQITGDDSNPDDLEHFTFAYRAVEALCRANPNASSICRTECGDPCLALPLPTYLVTGGCSLTHSATTSPFSIATAFCGVLVWCTRRKRNRVRRANRSS